MTVAERPATPGGPVAGAPVAGAVLPAESIPHACEPEDVAGAPAPRRTDRLVGIDAARGLALIGMMTVHILAAESADGDVALHWLLSAGKASALFAVLAGVGIALSTGGRRRPTGRRWAAGAVSLAVRAALIGLVGLLLGHVVDFSDAAVILPYYALLFLLAIPLLALRPAVLVALSVLLVGLTPVASHLLRADLPGSARLNMSFADVAADPAGMLLEITVTGTYPVLTWVSYLCVGLAVGRTDLTTRTRAAVLLLVGAAVATAASAGSWLVMTVAGGWERVAEASLGVQPAAEYAREVVVGMAGVTPTTTPWWLGVQAPHSGAPFDLAHTIGTSLAVIGLCLLLGRVARLRPLAAAGGMTLTLYTAHLLLLGAPLRPESDALWFAVQVLLLCGSAWLWAARVGRGPLETVVWWAAKQARQAVLGRPGGR